MACTQCAGGQDLHEVTNSLERLRYFPRQLLTADDMLTEQDYFRDKMRRHNLMLHGWGVVCGLQVQPAGPLAVQIRPGYALGPFGDEIHVEDCVTLDITHCTQPGSEVCVPRDGPAPDEAWPVYIKIRYVECPSRPMRTLPAGCGCDETACEYSRLRDGYEIRCFRAPDKEEPIPSRKPNPVAPDCRELPNDPWLVLARVVRAGPALQVKYAERRIVQHTPALANR